MFKTRDIINSQPFIGINSVQTVISYNPPIFTNPPPLPQTAKFESFPEKHTALSVLPESPEPKTRHEVYLRRERTRLLIRKGAVAVFTNTTSSPARSIPV